MYRDSGERTIAQTSVHLVGVCGRERGRERERERRRRKMVHQPTETSWAPGAQVKD